MFVDVAPNGGGCGVVKPAGMHPPTFTVLSDAEVEALCDDTLDDIEADAADADVEHREDEEETQSPSDDEASIDLGDWRAARQRVSRMRIPPGRAKPQAA